MDTDQLAHFSGSSENYPDCPVPRESFLLCKFSVFWTVVYKEIKTIFAFVAQYLDFMGVNVKNFSATSTDAPVLFTIITKICNSVILLQFSIFDNLV